MFLLHRVKCRDFTNLIMHKEDFIKKSKWYFFTTSHGENSENLSDGVGHNHKDLPLVYVFRGHWLANFEAPSTAWFCQKWYSWDHRFLLTNNKWMIEGEAKTIEGCKNNRQFIPSDSDMVMSRISGTDF